MIFTFDVDHLASSAALIYLIIIASKLLMNA